MPKERTREQSLQAKAMIAILISQVATAVVASALSKLGLQEYIASAMVFLLSITIVSTFGFIVGVLLESAAKARGTKSCEGNVLSSPPAQIEASPSTSGLNDLAHNPNAQKVLFIR